MTKKKENAQPELFKNAAAASKLVYKVEEVSRLTKVDAAVIEAWEQEFPFLRAGKTGGGQRYFRPKDIEIIRRIRELVEEKSLTMAGIRRRIEEEFGLRPTGPIHPEKLKRALYDVRDELQDIVVALDKKAKKGTG
jgi:DNA-binding transcriptional MerR regulator